MVIYIVHRWSFSDEKFNEGKKLTESCIQYIQEAEVKYGVRSPKFIWAPCVQGTAVLMAETP